MEIGKWVVHSGQSDETCELQISTLHFPEVSCVSSFTWKTGNVFTFLSGLKVCLRKHVNKSSKIRSSHRDSCGFWMNYQTNCKFIILHWTSAELNYLEMITQKQVEHLLVSPHTAMPSLTNQSAYGHHFLFMHSACFSNTLSQVQSITILL